MGRLLHCTTSPPCSFGAPVFPVIETIGKIFIYVLWFHKLLLRSPLYINMLTSLSAPLICGAFLLATQLCYWCLCTSASLRGSVPWDQMRFRQSLVFFWSLCLPSLAHIPTFSQRIDPCVGFILCPLSKRHHLQTEAVLSYSEDHRSRILKHPHALPEESLHLLEMFSSLLRESFESPN